MVLRIILLSIFFTILSVIRLSASDESSISLVSSQYKILSLPKNAKDIRIGEKKILSIRMMHRNDRKNIILFGKETGTTSMLITYDDNSYSIFSITVVKDISTLRTIIRSIDSGIDIKLDGTGHILIAGQYSSVAQRHNIEQTLARYGFSSEHIVDMAKTGNYDRLIRARLYAIEINENRAKDLRMNLEAIHDSSVKSFFQMLPSSPTFAGSLLSGGYQRFVGGINLNVLINFLQSQGAAKVVNDTMITIKEDHNGTIFVGGEIYIPTQISYDATGRPTIGTEAKKYGLTLTVTPTIIDKNIIDMHISLKSSDFDPDPTHRVTIGSDLKGNSILIPSFVSKESTTSVLAKSGQVIAIGGKLSSISAETKQKVPLLGDIPLLGYFFSSESKQIQQRDLIFFIVPTIETLNTIEDKTILSKYNIPSSKQVCLKETIPVDYTKEDNSSTFTIIYDDIEQIDIPVKKNSTKNNKVFNGRKSINYIEDNLYKVTVNRCFIRSMKTNMVMDIWKKGHAFIGKTTSDTGKIRIVKDCHQNRECTPVENQLLISAKCVVMD